MRRVRAVPEAEVIAEFLKKEFYNPEYHRDRESYEKIVLHPDLADEAECHVRRNLLYRRRRQLWRELPPNTTWWEVELEQADLAKLDIFPRGRLAGLSDGKLSLPTFVEHLKANRWKSKYSNEVTKIQSLRYEIAQYDTKSSAIFIGLSDHDQLSIFEGNHRIIAAYMVSPEKVLRNFRFFCGFSPRMTSCVWYRNNVPNLFSYLQRRFSFGYFDPKRRPSKEPMNMPARELPLQEPAEAPAAEMAAEEAATMAGGESPLKNMKSEFNQLRSNPLARNTFWMFTGQACSMFLKAAYFLIIARFLGPQQYGAFVGVSALVSILAPYATVGSGNLLIKNVSRDRSLFSVYWGNSLAISLVSGLGLMVLLMLVANVILPMRFPIALLATVALSDLLFARIVDVSAQAFQAVEKLSLTATLTSIINAARFAGAIVVVIFVHKPTAITWSYVYLASTIIAATIGVVSIHRKFGRPSTEFSRMPAEMAEGFFFAGSQSAQNIYNDIDKTMLARLSTLEFTGVYAAAYRLIDVAFVPIRALLFAAYAGFFRHGANGIRATRRYSRGLLYRAMGYGAIVSVALFVCAPAIPMVIGQQYALTATVLRWLSPLPFIKSIHYFEADTLTGSGYQGLRTSIQACVAVLNFGLNCWLIPIYSWKGAAWTSLASDSSLAISLIIASAYLARREESGSKISACPEEVEHAI